MWVDQIGSGLVYIPYLLRQKPDYGMSSVVESDWTAIYSSYMYYNSLLHTYMYVVECRNCFSHSTCIYSQLDTSNECRHNEPQ